MPRSGACITVWPWKPTTSGRRSRPATKAATGHLLGGTGALEAVFTILALQERTAPPTINVDNQDERIPLDVVTSPRALGDGPLLALSNSFGFGGHNSVVAFRSV